MPPRHGWNKVSGTTENAGSPPRSIQGRAGHISVAERPQTVEVRIDGDDDGDGHSGFSIHRKRREHGRDDNSCICDCGVILPLAANFILHPKRQSQPFLIVPHSESRPDQYTSL